MGGLIEDYALIGDTRTAALVGRDLSIDWLCLPRFDSAACFAALLGDEAHGRWIVRTEEEAIRCTRRYEPDTLVVETTVETASGSVRVVDCMPIASKHDAEGEHRVVRLVEGVRGRVAMSTELVIRFGYGQAVPWVQTSEGLLRAIAGPDALALATPVALCGRGLTTVGEFVVQAGDSVPFVLEWHASHRPVAPPGEARRLIEETRRWWREWVGRCTYRGEWREAVVRSLITLKALTFAPTGGVIAAPTTSLPEALGGVRNWDYRYCWLRDATLTLDSLLAAGYTGEAKDWRGWLVRAVAGNPADMQIVYGPAGERWLPELEIGALPGYEGAAPVRVGNAAADQLQLDVYGEVMDALYEARRCEIDADPMAWRLQRALLGELESRWREPDEGIWEVRSGRRHFTHSKVMAWLAFDRGVRTVESLGLDGPVERWRRVRDEIHADVCSRGFDARRGAFVRVYGGDALDASLLVLPMIGFLPGSDPRVIGTVDAVQRDLCTDGLVRRYSTPDPSADGLPPGEGAFLACSFWLVDALTLVGRGDEARTLFERLLSLRNDMGLLSEEYGVESRRFLGNFPQALSHTSLIRSAMTLAGCGDELAGRPRSRRFTRGHQVDRSG
ncbi:MAG: glycoside hydrolase family 15 protein [Actinobacteria bacterium]|nr:glycoside hydrolase family 15 protein [Actinomycetota bacterium]